MASNDGCYKDPDTGFMMMPGTVRPDGSVRKPRYHYSSTSLREIGSYILDWLHIGGSRKDMFLKRKFLFMKVKASNGLCLVRPILYQVSQSIISSMVFSRVLSDFFNPGLSSSQGPKSNYIPGLSTKEMSLSDCIVTKKKKKKSKSGITFAIPTSFNIFQVSNRTFNLMKYVFFKLSVPELPQQARDMEYIFD
jgi:hypothetical protein